MGQGPVFARWPGWTSPVAGKSCWMVNHAYIGHMDPPHGTSVVDVSDPASPRIVASIDIPPGLHSHKVRVSNGLMLVNRERSRGEKPADDFVGLRIFDVSRPGSPRDICHWECAGMGVHRFTFDGRYAYISAELEGYVGTIVMILDLQGPDPAGGSRPVVDGRAMDRRRRDPKLEGAQPSLPPSDPARRPPVCQLLVWRRRHPGHQRHGAGRRMISSLDWSPAVRLADAQPGADRCADRRPPLDAGRG